MHGHGAGSSGSFVCHCVVWLNACVSGSRLPRFPAVVREGQFAKGVRAWAPLRRAKNTLPAHARRSCARVP